MLSAAPSRSAFRSSAEATALIARKLPYGDNRTTAEAKDEWATA